MGGKTGRLVLFDEEGAVAGELTFRGGRLVGAHCGELTAEKAFYALLGLKTGSFDFDPTAELDEDDVNLPTESLLIEGMRRLDETYRLRRRLPAPAVVRYRRRRGRGPPRGARARLPRARARARVGDVVEGILVGGDADEYDALHALRRLARRGVVRVERPAEAGEADPQAGRTTST